MEQKRSLLETDHVVVDKPKLQRYSFFPSFLLDSRYSFIKSDREHRKFYLSLTNFVAIIVVAISFSTDRAISLNNSNITSLTSGALMVQFTIFLSLLLYFSPKECVKSFSPLYVCCCLCVAEFLIGGLKLSSAGAFSVRGVTYIQVGTTSMIDSSGCIEWTMFRLVGAITLECCSWLLLMIVHSTELSDEKVNTGILAHHAIVSIFISIPFWYLLFIYLKRRAHGDKKSNILKKLSSAYKSKNKNIFKLGNQRNLLLTNNNNNNNNTNIDNSILNRSKIINNNDSIRNDNNNENTPNATANNFQEPNEPVKIEYNIDANASLIRSTRQSADDVTDENISKLLSETTQRERDAIKIVLNQKITSIVMIALHLFVTIFVVLELTITITPDEENVVYAVFVNSALCLWQVGKIFLEYGWDLSAQSIRHQYRVERAQKDTIRTIKSLSDELKWPLGTLRGLRLLKESSDTIDLLKNTTRSLIWVGHLMKMLQIGNEALVRTRVTRRPRKIALQNLIRAMASCLSCQTSTSIKDLDTSVSINGTQINLKNKSKDANSRKGVDIQVVANQDALLYGLLGMHALIVSLADSHQTLRMDFTITKSDNGEEATVEGRIMHWGLCPVWDSTTSSTIQSVDEDRIGIEIGGPGGPGSSDSSSGNRTEVTSDIYQLVVDNLRAAIGGTIHSRMRGRMCETIFTVTLPTKSVLKDTIKQKDPNKKITILLVEDSLVARKMLKKAIEDSASNTEIEECQNGEEAVVRVAHLGQEKFDFIFLDYYLGTEKEMTGVQLCMKLRQYSAHATIIGVTGDDNGIALPDFLLNGADMVFLKPLSKDILAEIFDENGSSNKQATAIGSSSPNIATAIESSHANNINNLKTEHDKNDI